MQPQVKTCPFSKPNGGVLGPGPIHLRRPVLNTEILKPVLRQAGLTAMPADPHVTLASMPNAEDHQARALRLSPHRLAVSPSRPRLVRLSDGKELALEFEAPDLTARWRELREADPDWGPDAFTPRIVLGPAPETLPAICFFAGPVLFGPETVAPPGQA